MTTIDLDPDKLEQFVFRAVEEVGATLNTALVVMGDELGLYRALADAGPLTSAELAARTGTAERYVREWLNAQAAGGYIGYHPAEGAYSLAPEQAAAFCDEDSPAYLPGAVPGRARRGARLAADHRRRSQRRRRRLARAQPSRARRLRAVLPPRLQRQPRRVLAARARRGRRASLQRGARVADVGCGHGASTILMAQAFPESTFVGSDYHAESIETARAPRRAGRRRRSHPLRGRARRELHRRAATTW